eukprot:CAMPEP_0194215878 /NCGR_PEP_ID=MMETSP0156-20130528/17972_1 /TAXON_ID=33649 /ORGANISM="Thalassionema nitzschioides, Strain L26-B" /LENGTH=415 /DNA_ID=CAMNT_0038944511 /DNA_START=113 /DNA_END=1360 /DNA_ORIENTATION=-
MESPPVVDHSPTAGGVATLPNQHIRSLISASQGPRPLSNVFTYQTSRTRFSPFVRSTTRSITISSRDEGAADSKDDERKPAPRNIRNTGRSCNSDEIPPLLGRTVLDLDSTLSRTTQSGDSTISSAPLTRAARRRRNSSNGIAPPAKRRAVASKEDKPASLKSDPDESSSTCCICMSHPDVTEVATIDGCDHKFCFNCIEKWSDRENTCPLCKNRFNRINRVMRGKGKRKKGQKGTKKVKQRDQRADLNPNNGFDSLLANISGTAFQNPIARLIFSGLPSSMDLVPQRRDGRVSRYRNAPSHIEEALYSDNDEGSDGEGSGYQSFVDTMRRVSARSGGDLLGAYPILAGSLRGRPLRSVMFPTTAMAAPVPSRVTRSYAANADDVNAGGTADNALEIVDDSDDEVEVVDVVGRSI